MMQDWNFRYIHLFLLFFFSKLKSQTQVTKITTSSKKIQALKTPPDSGLPLNLISTESISKRDPKSRIVILGPTSQTTHQKANIIDIQRRYWTAITLSQRRRDPGTTQEQELASKLNEIPIRPSNSRILLNKMMAVTGNQ